MKVTIESEYEIGQKVVAYTSREAIEGTVIDIKWNEKCGVFMYLVEVEDKSRNWHYGDNLKKLEASK